MSTRPRHLVDRQRFRPVLAVALALGIYAIGLYVLPLIAIVWLQAVAMPWLLKAVFTLPMIGLSASGLYLLASLGHEGLHFNLCGNRTLSAYLGCAFSSMMPLYCASGYFVYHLQHHQHANTERDPDLLHFGRYRSLLSRLFVARPCVNFLHFAMTLRLAYSARSIAHGLPMRDEVVQWLARFNLLMQVLLLASYAGVLRVFPAAALPWSMAFAGALILSGLNTYQEHAFIVVDRDSVPLQFLARSRVSRCISLLQAGSNFHVEHHLYPNIPCWRLPSVHRRLVVCGWYEHRSHLIESRFLGSYGSARSRYRYGDES